MKILLKTFGKKATSSVTVLNLLDKISIDVPRNQTEKETIDRKVIFATLYARLKYMAGEVCLNSHNSKLCLNSQSNVLRLLGQSYLSKQ